MEQVLDGLKRHIFRGINTTTPLTADLASGSDTLQVRATTRFNPGDEVLLRRPAKGNESGGKYEHPANLAVAAIIDETHLQLNRAVQTDWLMADAPVLTKMIDGQFIQGIYLGDPENISQYPAIVLNGMSQESAEWMTFDSVKTTFNVEIGIYVLDSTQEAGYRFLLKMAKMVAKSLTEHIFPLANDFDVVQVTQNVSADSPIIHVSDTSSFCLGYPILIEDQFKTVEHKVNAIDPVANTITVYGPQVGLAFQLSDAPVVIKPNRFIYNSYPRRIDFGKIHKGTLLKAAVIDWFGDEEVLNAAGGGGWSDPNIR